MKKGISIWSFADSDLSRAFALAKKAGFEGVEIALAADGELSLSATDPQVAAIKSKADAAGIQLYSVASGLGWSESLSASDPGVRKKAVQNARRQLEVAAILGCDTILLIPGHVAVEWQPGTEVIPYAVAWERVMEGVEGLAGYAGDCKVSIGLENVWNSFLLSPLEMRDFIDAVASPWVGAYFDVGNAMANGYPEHWIEILGSRIKKVHFKDYRRAAGGLHGFVDLLAGEANWPAVTAALEAAGYGDWVTAEMLPPYAHFPETIIYNTSRAMDQILGR